MKIKNTFIISIVLLLTGCMASDFHFNLDTLNRDVVSIEIVKVTKVLNEDRKIEIITLLKEDQRSDFLTDLSNIEFIWTLGRPQRANGECIRLNLTNGYELICDSIVINFNSNTEQYRNRDIYKPKNFDTLIQKYK